MCCQLSLKHFHFTIQSEGITPANNIYKLQCQEFYIISGVGMHQDGMLDDHKVLPCQHNLAGQTGADPRDSGMRWPAITTPRMLYTRNLYVRMKSTVSRHLEH